MKKKILIISLIIFVAFVAFCVYAVISGNKSLQDAQERAQQHINDDIYYTGTVTDLSNMSRDERKSLVDKHIVITGTWENVSSTFYRCLTDNDFKVEAYMDEFPEIESNSVVTVDGVCTYMVSSRMKMTLCTVTNIEDPVIEVESVESVEQEATETTVASFENAEKQSQTEEATSTVAETEAAEKIENSEELVFPSINEYIINGDAGDSMFKATVAELEDDHFNVSFLVTGMDEVVVDTTRTFSPVDGMDDQFISDDEIFVLKVIDSESFEITDRGFSELYYLGGIYTVMETENVQAQQTETNGFQAPEDEVIQYYIDKGYTSVTILSHQVKLPTDEGSAASGIGTTDTMHLELSCTDSEGLFTITSTKGCVYAYWGEQMGWKNNYDIFEEESTVDLSGFDGTYWTIEDKDYAYSKMSSFFDDFEYGEGSKEDTELYFKFENMKSVQTNGYSNTVYSINQEESFSTDGLLGTVVAKCGSKVYKNTFELTDGITIKVNDGYCTISIPAGGTNTNTAGNYLIIERNCSWESPYNLSRTTKEAFEAIQQ